ncbi:MAG: tRNA (adenosine(37)-N6)-threonylcarbamoyltransferase complex dimerization subunit type 1 TsaB [Hornefia sp.]|nr:tRNA (adenosine(37)-N6)-threonylcarbamoyltransferase complex dimerization subunit type 1 TsaB [Hornefia sp.]
MYILGFETTGALGSAALYNLDTDEIRCLSVNQPMEHLKNIIGLAKRLLDDEKAGADELKAVAASVGPGSYTGIRIGVSSARAVAQGLNIPCISVPSLDIFKEKCKGDTGCAVIFNARRGQVYGAVFDETGRDVLKAGPYMLSDVVEAVSKSGKDIVFYGDGVSAYRNSEDYGYMLENKKLAAEKDLLPTAEMVVRYGAEVYRKGNTCSYTELEPSYMRETEAEQKLRDGTLDRLRKEKMAKFAGR